MFKMEMDFLKSLIPKNLEDHRKMKIRSKKADATFILVTVLVSILSFFIYQRYVFMLYKFNILRVNLSGSIVV